MLHKMILLVTKGLLGGKESNHQVCGFESLVLRDSL